MATNFVAGAYTVTWGGLSIGQIKDGITIITRDFGEHVTGDNCGGVPQDTVIRSTECRASFVCLEWTTVNKNLLYMLAGTSGAGKTGLPGRLVSSLWLPLVMTVVPGTAAVGNPTTITATQAAVEIDTDNSIMYGNHNREIAFVTRWYPYLSGGSYTNYIEA